MGLMFQKQIDPRGGILMVQDTQSRVNAAIHMFFMNFDIAVIWLDNQLRVVDAKIARKWQPMLGPIAPARYILETHPDRISDFNIGDQIEITPS
jgi:uncharacterized membrane protein (UPF0127 family)